MNLGKMYALLNMGIFQQAMLVYWSVAALHPRKLLWNLKMPPWERETHRPKPPIFGVPCQFTPTCINWELPTWLENGNPTTSGASAPSTWKTVRGCSMNNNNNQQQQQQQQQQQKKKGGCHKGSEISKQTHCMWVKIHFVSQVEMMNISDRINFR